VSRPQRTPENPSAISDEERDRVLTEVGIRRAYRDYAFVVLLHAIDAPPRGTSMSNFPGTKYRFFVEGDMFCIECRETGIVCDFPMAQVRVARRPRPVAKESAA
jgi:hypothetical protein